MSTNSVYHPFPLNISKIGQKFIVFFSTMDFYEMLFLFHIIKKTFHKSPLIHFSWKATTTKLSNLPTWFGIDEISMTLGVVLVSNKEGIFQLKKNEFNKHVTFKTFYYILVPNQWFWSNKCLWVSAWLMIILNHVHVRFKHQLMH
jgi:hypothetical protein